MVLAAVAGNVAIAPAWVALFLISLLSFSATGFVAYSAATARARVVATTPAVNFPGCHPKPITSHSRFRQATLKQLQAQDSCTSDLTYGTDYESSKLTDHWYLVAASDSDERDFNCAHAKWVYSDDTLHQYVLHWKDDHWDGMNRTYDKVGDAKFSTDTGDCYILDMGTYDDYEYVITYTCGDYFDGVEVYWAKEQSIDDSFLDYMNDKIDDADLSDYTVKDTEDDGCSDLTYAWW